MKMKRDVKFGRLASEIYKRLREKSLISNHVCPVEFNGRKRKRKKVRQSWLDCPIPCKSWLNFCKQLWIRVQNNSV
jgi:hypothetical protein